MFLLSPSDKVPMTTLLKYCPFIFQVLIILCKDSNHCGIFISVPTKDSVQTFLFLPKLIVFWITWLGLRRNLSQFYLPYCTKQSWLTMNPSSLRPWWVSPSCLPQLTIFSQWQPSQPQSSQSCLHTQFGRAGRSILPLSAAQRHLKCPSSCIKKPWLILSHCKAIWYWDTSTGTKFC